MQIFEKYDTPGTTCKESLVWDKEYPAWYEKEQCGRSVSHVAEQALIWDLYRVARELAASP